MNIERINLVEPGRPTKYTRVEVTLAKVGCKWSYGLNLQWGSITVGSGGFSFKPFIDRRSFDSRENAFDAAVSEAVSVLRRAAAYHRDSDGGRKAKALAEEIEAKHMLPLFSAGKEPSCS